MKVIVFGPTGQTGLQIISSLLEDTSHEVRVFVRRPKRLPKHLKDRVDCVVGDVLDADAVNNALEGQDIVFSSLGPGWNLKPTTLMSDGVKNIVAGMRTHGVKKLICMGQSFLLKEPDREGFHFLRHVTADHKRAVEYLSIVDDVQWIALMPPRILARSFTSDYRTAVDKMAGPAKVTTADIAALMIAYAEDEAKFTEHNRKLVGVSSFLTFWQACCGCNC